MIGRVLLIETDIRRPSVLNLISQDEIKKAGFSNVVVKNYVFKYSPGNFDQYWGNYLRYVAKPIKEKLNLLEKSQKKELKEMIRKNTKPYTKRDGEIQFPWEVLILTAKY